MFLKFVNKEIQASNLTARPAKLWVKETTKRDNHGKLRSKSWSRVIAWRNQSIHIAIRLDLYRNSRRSSWAEICDDRDSYSTWLRDCRLSTDMSVRSRDVYVVDGAMRSINPLWLPVLFSVNGHLEVFRVDGIN